MQFGYHALHQNTSKKFVINPAHNLIPADLDKQMSIRDYRRENSRVQRLIWKMNSRLKNLTLFLNSRIFWILNFRNIWILSYPKKIFC